VNSRKGSEQAEQVGEPDDDNDDNHPVQDGFDARLHGYEAIHEPQQYSYGDERNDELHERHLNVPLSASEADLEA
jgi:hypothetical protein